MGWFMNSMDWRKKKLKSLDVRRAANRKLLIINWKGSLHREPFHLTNKGTIHRELFLIISSMWSAIGFTLCSTIPKARIISSTFLSCIGVIIQFPDIYRSITGCTSSGTLNTRVDSVVLYDSAYTLVLKWFSLILRAHGWTGASRTSMDGLMRSSGLKKHSRILKTCVQNQRILLGNITISVHGRKGISR